MFQDVTLVEELERDGIELWMEGDQLRYRAPAGRLTPEYKAGIIERKAELIATIRARNGATRAPAPVLPGAQSVWAPTVGQRSLAMSPHLPSVRALWCWPGRLDIALLQQVIDEIASRHDALRTRYVVDAESRIWAVTQRQMRVDIQVFDLENLGEAQREPIRLKCTTDLFTAPFPLDTGPLWRVAVLRMSEQESVVILVVHHSIFDAVSKAIFHRELTALYQAGLRGETLSLPMPGQLEVLARAQVDALRSATAQTRMEYWRKKLANADAPFWLPTDRRTPVPAARTRPPVAGTIELGAVEALRAVCLEEKSTLAIAVAATLGIVLRGWSGRDDIFLWMAHNGRPRPEWQSVIGFLADYSLLRMDFSADPTFRNALRRVHGCYVESVPHIDVPPTAIKPMLTRYGTRASYPATTLNFISLRTEAIAQTAAPTSALFEETGKYSLWLQQHIEAGPRFALVISGLELPDCIRWRITHSQEMFEDETIARLCDCLQHALQFLSFQPDARISDLFSCAGWCL